MVADQWIKTRVPGTTTIVQQAEFEYPHVYNSLGLMDREPVRKATGEYRILALGDSFTDGASTWPAFLQRMLSASRPDSRLTVINGGNGGSDPFFAHMLLREKLLALEPNLVIVAVNQSDIDDVLFLGGFERFLPGRRAQFRDGPAWEWIYGPSFIARHVVHDLLDYDRGFIKRSTLDTVRAESVQRLDEAVDAFRELSRRHGFDLLVVVHPTQEEVDGGLLELKPLVEHLRRRGLPS